MIKCISLQKKDKALRKVIILLFVLFHSFLNAKIIDNASILSPDFKAQLSKNLQNLPESSSIFILTLNSIKSSPALLELNKQMANKDKIVVALIIYPEKKQSFIAANSFAYQYLLNDAEEDYLSFINTHRLAPYLRSGFVERGVKNAVDELSSSLGAKKSFEILPIHIAAAIILIALMIYILIKNRKTLHATNIAGGLFLGVLMATMLAYPFYMFLDWLFFRFGSTIFLYSVDIALFSGIAIFSSLFWYATTQTKEDIEENIKKSSESSQTMSEYGRYSSSSYGGGYSSYSGGGGSFGGGGASGSW